MKRRLFIQTLLLGSGCIMLKPKSMMGINLDKHIIKISMIYNNTGNSQDLKNAWGLSIWIEMDNRAILFDTGGNGSILWGNIVHSDINMNKLADIVISHDHWDHKNGLNVILEKSSNKPDIYVVENDYKKYVNKFQEANIKSVSTAKQIHTNVWTTGQLTGTHRGEDIYEQSLILIQDDSLVLLTGCSHSGIVDMVRKVNGMFPDKRIELVAGGFHLLQKPDNKIKEISNQLKDLNVDKIAPSHCTGKKALNLFKADWGNRYLDLNLGSILDL